jgi:hypothetical protein
MHSVGNGTHNTDSGRVVWIFEIRDQLGASKTARLASTPSKATKYAPCGTLKEKPYRDALRMEIAAAEEFKDLRAIARAHLGGNATGFMTTEYTVGAKWLDLLKDIAPGLTRSSSGSHPGFRNQPVCRHPGSGAIAQGGGEPGQHARGVRD